MTRPSFMVLALAATTWLGCERADRSGTRAAPGSSSTTSERTSCALGEVLCSGACTRRTAPECETACQVTSACSSAGAGGEGAGGDGPSKFGPANVTCSFEISASLSPKIASVGIVEWSTDLGGVDEALIEFGLDADYGKLAPVDLTEPRNRTLLLGMKPERAYQYRIWARAGSEVCMSEGHTLTTGPESSRLPQLEIATLESALLSPGYVVTTEYSGGSAFVIDEEGDFVWWFEVGNDVASARMSFDGKHMWLNVANVPRAQARVLKVSMDGLEVEDLSEIFEGQNHQLCPLPDGAVAFYAYGDNGCDDIKEYHPEFGVRHIINAADAHGETGRCHLNTIEYSAADDTLVFSDLAHDNYTKVTRSGEVVWVLGGAQSDFKGSGAVWTHQHGIHLLGLDRLVFFNNGAIGDSGSFAAELELDLGSMTATRVWEYTRDGFASTILGDVQRLPNGNTLVVYSATGSIHEVSPNKDLVQEIRWDFGGQFGYAMKRTTLYGPPPK